MLDGVSKGLGVRTVTIAVIALLALAGALAFAGHAAAEPPSWWADHVGAGPPGWVPTHPDSPPLDVAKPAWFEHQLAGNDLEIAAIEERLLELNVHIVKSPFETLVISAIRKLAEHACLPVGVVIDLYELYHQKETIVAGLSIPQLQLRLNEDREYVEYLNRWFSQYNPAYKNIWDSSRQWVHNADSPFNAFNDRFHSELKRTSGERPHASCKKKRKQKHGHKGGSRSKKHKGGCAIDPFGLASVASCGEPPSNRTCRSSLEVAIDALALPNGHSGIGELTSHPSGGDEISNGTTEGGSTESVWTWDCGKSVTLHATPAMGSHFVGWKRSSGAPCSGAGESCTFKTRESDPESIKGVAAEFAPTLYTLSVTNSGADSGAVEGDDATEFPEIDCGNTMDGSGTFNTVCTTQAEAATAPGQWSETLRMVGVSDGDGGYYAPQPQGCDAVQNGDADLDTLTPDDPNILCQITLTSDREVSVTWKLVEGNPEG